MSQSLPVSLVAAVDVSVDPSTTPGGPLIALANLIGGVNTGAANTGVGIATGNAGMLPTDGFSEPAATGNFVSDIVGQSGTDALPDAVNPAGTINFLAADYALSDYNDQVGRNVALADIAPDAAEDSIVNRSGILVLAGQIYHGIIALL